MAEHPHRNCRNAIENEERRAFIILIAEAAAIATLPPSVHPVLTADRRLTDCRDVLTREEQFARLRTIVDDAIRSGNRRRMLTEGHALGLSDVQQRALESVTVAHLRALSRLRPYS